MVFVQQSGVAMWALGVTALAAGAYGWDRLNPLLAARSGTVWRATGFCCKAVLSAAAWFLVLSIPVSCDEQPRGCAVESATQGGEASCR